ncbi:rhomboid family intramembrane serine protease [Crocinitomicaceae bacterium]|jgi:membrane associated rhomboid family serine protease|nr:rhomboid family intramembrane serine protease [Crocinitomicaceae bacterium]MDO7610054.1 rhomboid family intramembrane serine protease [Crocinitomicaceae bacterium]
MGIGITEIIVALTCLISWQALNNQNFQNQCMFIPYNVKHSNEYYRLLSHVLVHADFAHLAFNMISMFYLGKYLEMELVYEYGNLGMYYFIILYLLGGLAATILPYSRNSDNSMYRSLGASGAVSAVVFATIMWNPQLELMLLFIPIPIKAYILGPIYLAVEYYSMRRGGSGIAHDAHIGGALFGILFVLLIDPNKGVEFLRIFE